jgi:DNA-binding MarR family transcriptional regulator
MGTARAGDEDAESLMRLIHLVEAESRTRTTQTLDLRARLLIQELGLYGPSTLVDVRRRLGLSPSTTTSLADRLERDGYVERRRSVDDRRVVLLALTGAGEKAYANEKAFYRRLIQEVRPRALALLAGQPDGAAPRD